MQEREEFGWIFQEKKIEGGRMVVFYFVYVVIFNVNFGWWRVHRLKALKLWCLVVVTKALTFR